MVQRLEQEGLSSVVITRRAALRAGGIGLLVASQPGLGQGVAAVRRIGWLSIGSKDSPADLHAEFKYGMRDLGWQEGKNVEYQFLYADGSMDRLDAMVAELVRRAVDVVIVINLKTARSLGLTAAPSLRMRADEVVE